MISKKDLKLSRLYSARTTFQARSSLFPYNSFSFFKKKSRKTERVDVEGQSHSTSIVFTGSQQYTHSALAIKRQLPGQSI